MSKKKKSRYVANEPKVVAIGEKITFNKNEEENHMDLDWFYLDDISWFMTADGRIVAPVAGVVRHLGRPRGYVGPSDNFAPKDGCRAMYFSTAEQCIVDVMPFGKCYEKSSLESLWDSLNGHGVSASESEKTSENEGQFVNCQKFSEISEEAKSEEAENG